MLWVRGLTCCLLLLGLLVCPLHADNSRTEAILDSALYYMYNYQLERSHQLFQSLTDTFPPHPLAPLGALVTRWEQDQYTLGFEQGNQLLLKQLDEYLKVYERMMDQNQTPTLLLFYGAARGLKSRILLAEKDWLGVLVNGYKAIQYVLRARDEDPELWDVYLPIGVYEYYVSISSSLVRLISETFIMESDREIGLEHLRLAAARGNYGQREAKGILAFVLMYMEEDYLQSLKYSEELDGELPGNPYYAFLACEARLLLGDTSRADLHLKKIKKITADYQGYQLEEWEQKLALLEGTRAYVVGNYQKAESIFNNLIASYSMEFDWHLSYAYLRLGKVYDLKGERQKARYMYHQVLKLDNRTSAARWAKKFLDEPFQGTPLAP